MSSWTIGRRITAGFAAVIGIAGLDAALRNRPRALVAVAEERTSGVDEEHLDRVGGRAALAVHQEPRADFSPASSVGHFTMVSSVATETAW